MSDYFRDCHVSFSFPSVFSVECMCVFGVWGGEGEGGRLNNGKESKERTIQFWIVADEG